MRNLLTLSFKHKLRQEYLLRVFSVAFWMLTSSMVIGALGLLPAYVLSEARLNALQDQYTFLQASVASLTSDTSATPLTGLKRKLDVLSKEKNDARLTDAVLSVLSYRGEGVVLGSFDYSTTGNTSSLKLRGVAKDRDSLLSFERALRQDGRFGKVELPVSSLVREKDIEFDLTLSGTF